MDTTYTTTTQHHFEEIVASRERGRVAKEAAAKAEVVAVDGSAQ